MVHYRYGNLSVKYTDQDEEPYTWVPIHSSIFNLTLGRIEAAVGTS